MCKYHMFVFQFHFKHRIRQFLQNSASTSITSAFDIFYLLCHDNNCCLQIRKRQNLWFPIGDEDRVFIVGGK